MNATMTLQQVADLYQVSAKTLKSKIRKLDLGIDTSSLLYPKDLRKLFDALGHPEDLIAQQRDVLPVISGSTKTKILIFLLLTAFPSLSSAQIIYATGEIPPLNPGVLIKIDLNNCIFCAVSLVNDGSDNDITLLPNGNFVNTSNLNIKVFSPPNQNPIFTVNISPLVALGNILNPDGTLYIATRQGLGLFNPVTNQFTYLGNWPSSFLPVVQMELWYEGGQLYGYFGFPVQQVAQIDVNNPGNSTIVGAINFNGFIQGATDIGGMVLMADNNIVYQYNNMTGNLDVSCDFSNTTLLILGISNVPDSFPDYPCLCSTSAGTIAPQSLTNYCENETITVPYNGNASLDNNDLLQYILFSDPTDTAGSIVAVGNTPSFAFAPPMQTGIVYYMATMAGNNLNGDVDINDPCLDFSNANPIVWRLLPTIVLTAANPDVCGIDGCTNLTATMVGTPPFLFIYEVQINGVTIGNSTTVNANSNPHIFTVCMPPGVSIGQVQVVVCSLTDFYCTTP
jgi:hypothetical protein